MDRFILTALINASLSSFASAQITFEHEYPVNAASVLGPVLIEIAPDEHKYMVQEIEQGSFTLYNLDHTIFMGNITSPVPLYQAPTYYFPALVSRSLFDCESSTVEFAVAATYPDTSTDFNIVRTDGTILFTEENATLPYCFGCAVGTRMDQGVFNTEDGAKMIMMITDGIPNEQRYRIYSLCGILPDGLLEYPGAVKAALYPNPGNTTMTFELPNDAGSGAHVLEVHDTNGKLMLSIPFQGRSVQFDGASKGLAPGAYTCRVLGSGTSFIDRFVLTP